LFLSLKRTQEVGHSGLVQLFKKLFKVQLFFSCFAFLTGSCLPLGAKMALSSLGISFNSRQKKETQ
jgi:hypothetical protein